ncbi:MAG: diguanylate cyclase, partial [Frankiaceae bacterium]|nr:diguanylate cyclase [Frankiaceae bacterium]
MDTGGWAAEQLTAFLAALSNATHVDVLAQRAVDLAAEAVEAEAAAFLEAGVVRSVIGWPAGRAPSDVLADNVTASGEMASLPELGECRIFAAIVDEDRDQVLLVARIGDTPFSYEERNLLRAMSRVMALTLRSCEQLQEERERRGHIERQASEYRQLITAIEERQALLERLTRILRSINTGAPLQQVLHAIAAGAKELLRCDVVTLRRVDENNAAVIVASDGHEQGSPIAAKIELDTGISGQAITEQRLVVAHDYQADERSHETTRAFGIKAGMATPVREYGVVVGCLTVGSREPGRTFSEAEQETLVSFAAHASLAISEARTADALRRALQDAQHDAMHDPLTGLANRALLRTRLDQVAKARRYGDATIALLFLDIDNFKHINDSLGHDVGDALLVAVA